MAYIKKFSGGIYFEVNSTGIRKFAGLDEYKVEDDYIKDIYGRILYKIEGRLSRIELMFVLTLLFEENY